MKQVIELAALVEGLSSEAMVEEKLRLSAENGQVKVEVAGWESRFEVPAEHLNQALAALAPRDEPPVSLTMVQHIGQKLSRLEQQVAANPHQRLDLEALRENLEALQREVMPRLVVVETWKERIEALENQQITHHAQLVELQRNSGENDAAIVELEETAQNFGDRIAVLENNLAEPPAKPAALALYGGELMFPEGEQ